MERVSKIKTKGGIKMKFKSKAKEVTLEAIEREREFLNSCEVGTDEYNESQERLNKLNSKLIELEQVEIDSKDRFVKYVIEIVKIVAGVGVPFACFIMATAQEREITYTGAARMLLGSLMPGGKKLI